MAFNDAVQLLHHHQAVYLFGKIPDQIYRQRIQHTQLQHADAVAKDLFYILIAGTGGDNAQLGAAHLHPVIGTVFRQLPQCLRPGLHLGVPCNGIGRHHNIFCYVLLIGLLRRHHPILQLNDALGMGNPSTHPQDHRGIIFLGQLEGCLGKCLGLRRIRRLQHGHLGRNGIVPGVLLILRGMHPRIIRHADHNAAVDAGIGQGKQRIRRHVQSHMLHGAAAANPRQGCAKGGLQGDLLVGRPFRIDFRIFRRFLGDFRGGRARIAGDQAAPRLIESPADCGIADI